jgi:hypothetical protein
LDLPDDVNQLFGAFIQIGGLLGRSHQRIPTGNIASVTAYSNGWRRRIDTPGSDAGLGICLTGEDARFVCRSAFLIILVP